jgi:hypothetical protein
VSVRTATAVKAALEALGLGMPVYTDRPAPGRQPPHVVVVELSAGALPEGHGDFGSQTADEAVAELVQVDVTQRVKDPAGRMAEDPTVPDRIAAAMRGARLTTAPWHVYGVQLDSFGPRREITPGTAQTTITLRIRRALRRL